MPNPNCMQHSKIEEDPPSRTEQLLEKLFYNEHSLKSELFSSLFQNGLSTVYYKDMKLKTGPNNWIVHT